MTSLTLTILDDFYPDPWAVRDYALRLPYEDAKSGREKTYYKGLLTTPHHAFAAVGIELMTQAMGRPVSSPAPTGEFRLLLAPKAERDFSRTWIHSDSVATPCAGLVYLNPPDQCAGGTSFYRHRAFGWEQMPTEGSHEAAHAAATTGASFPELVQRLADDGFEVSEKWDMVMHVPMRFNRCLVFDGSYFHARTGTFGSGARDGRLTQNFFFNLGRHR